MSTSMQSSDTNSHHQQATKMKRFNQHDTEIKVKTKPPMVPMKRKKKISETTSQPDNSNTNITEVPTNKIKAKRQKIEDSRVKIEMPKQTPAAPAKESTITKVTSKPPIPPKPDSSIISQIMNVKQPKMKKKLEETNTAMVQKLNALAEKLRLENADLMKALSSEKSAVRTLRAQNDSETRRAKLESKKLQGALAAQSKIATKRESVAVTNSSGGNTPNGGHDLNVDLTRLNQEIVVLKDANKHLEEKLQSLNEAERKQSSDIHEMKDMYEIRLTQTNKTIKAETQRLLEEIKTKERLIGQLKKEMETLKGSSSKRRNAQNGSDMRKLKDIEHNTLSISSSNCKTNKIKLSTTCGKDSFPSKSHEEPERILEAHEQINHYDKTQTDQNHVHDHSQITDTDSALSSAPSSLSPQPVSCPNSPDIWTITKDNRGLNKIDHLQKELDAVRDENEMLKCELAYAQEQVRELEKTLVQTRDCSNDRANELMDKLKYLEEKEDSLMHESHELREQNELLEFRIIELEESHDKWSLRSNTNPDTRDVWTDTDGTTHKDLSHDVDIMLMADRTDSGITSPNCNHRFDDSSSMTSPCDLSIDQDEIRKRLMIMSKRLYYDDEDKMCILQVLSLLNNLEALSQDQDAVTAATAATDVDTMVIDQTQKPHLDSPSRLLPSQTTRNPRIVATIQPYNSNDSPTRTRSLSSSSLAPHDSPKKAKFCSSSSLQESGVFEGDLYELVSESTQTEPEDFPIVEKPHAELCAEIQKLNKFRERIEECVTKSSCTTPTSKPVVGILTETSEQRRLQYYRDRLELLENKILVYESTGDLQIRRLAERLQREIQLESAVKQLTGKVDKLMSDNLLLEEEKCEFEEAENDTRLRLQRLEFDLEILSQRNVELEMSRNSLKSKAQDYQQHSINLEDSIQKYQEKVFLLEEREMDLKDQIEVLGKLIPVLMLFNLWKSNEWTRLSGESTPISCSCLTEMRKSPSPTHWPRSSAVEDRFNEMVAREKELTRNIAELNKAYNETLENADNLWAQMERDYKEKLARAEENEGALKCKLFQLEERIRNDTQFAQERILQLEDSETNYKQRLNRLNRDNKHLTEEVLSFQEEVYTLKEENESMQAYIERPIVEQLEKEKRKAKTLEEQLILLTRNLKDVESVSKSELTALKTQFAKACKELIHIEVTNGELREEILTLESQIRELKKQKNQDEDQINELTIELQSKLRQNSELQEMQTAGAPMNGARSLAQELAMPSRRSNISSTTTGSKDLTAAMQRLQDAIENMENCNSCRSYQSEFHGVAKEIRDFVELAVANRDRFRSGRRSTTISSIPYEELVGRQPEFV